MPKCGNFANHLVSRKPLPVEGKYGNLEPIQPVCGISVNLPQALEEFG